MSLIGEESDNPNYNSMTDITERDVLTDTRQSNRLQAKGLVGHIEQGIETQSTFHKLVMTELSTEISFDRLTELKTQMGQSPSLGEINQTFDKLKVLTVSESVTSPVLRDIDRVTADNRKLVERIDTLLHKRSARPKTGVNDGSGALGDDSHVPQSVPAQSVKALSIHSHLGKSDAAYSQSLRSHSNKPESVHSQSLRSQSVHSGKSYSSSFYKVKAKEAAAKVAAAKAKLRVEMETKLMEEELALLEMKQKEEALARKRHIMEIKLRAEVDAEMEQQRIFEEALLEEGEETQGPLLRPPQRLTTPTMNAESPTQEHLVVSELSEKIAITVGETVAAAISLSRLPTPEPCIFDGDPLQYADWKVAFYGLIDNKKCSNMEKLHLLKR
jgi:hypothetical protein